MILQIIKLKILDNVMWAEEVKINREKTNTEYSVRFLFWVGLSCVLYCGFGDMVKLHKFVRKGRCLYILYMLIISAIR